MKLHKKWLAWLLVLTMVITIGLTGCGQQEEEPAPVEEEETVEEVEEEEETTSEMEDGVYTGSAIGNGGELVVEVTVENGEVTDIEVVDHLETKMISDMPINELPDRILEAQTVNVDAIAGATITSNAVRRATEMALEEAGADMDVWKADYEEEVVTDKAEEELEAEVAIIGTGGAGLAAAVSAYEHGAESIIIVEKMPMIGGNTMRGGGALNAIDPPRQDAQGIEDSIDKHYEQTMEGGHNVADPDLVRTLVENAPDAVYWLEDYGFVWQEKIGSAIGSLWHRSHQAEEPLGTGYIEVLGQEALDQGAEILVDTKATDLIVEDGRVVGFHAESPDTIYTIKGTKGVIIASGGYGGDVEMAKEYLDDGVYTADILPDNLTTTNQPGATGDGIRMAEEIGAQIIDMEHIQLLPMPGDRFGPSINVEDSLFINLEGDRFVREDGSRDEICLAVFDQPEGQYYMISDDHLINDRKTLSGEDLDTLIAKGIVTEADTIEELAEAIDIDPEKLQAQVDNFNEMVENEEDPEFGRQVWGTKLDQPPYHATLRFPALHHTMGGIKINPQTQVLDENDEPIPGLFAAGEVTGGIHGGNRLGGNAFADIMVFGRIAGEEVMK